MTSAAETLPGAGLAPAPLAIRVIAAATCAVCWADPGMPCGDARGELPGLHLARYARAARSGIIPLAVAVAVLEAAGPVFTSHTLVLTSAASAAADEWQHAVDQGLGQQDLTVVTRVMERLASS